MPTFGIHAFVWNGDWNNQIAPETIRLTAEAGFDLLEIPLLHPEEVDAAAIKKLLRDHGLKASASLALPKDAHLPFYPEKARAFLTSVVEKVAEMEIDTLCGCVYCNLGTLTEAAPTEAELNACAEVLSDIADQCKTHGIRLGIEPVNRYETYLLNVGSDTKKLIDQMGRDNVFIHFDTYHMVIEEEGYSAPIIAAGDLCGYIHLSESGRAIPGMGNVDWDDVFTGLKAVNFTGPLVLEAFATINPELIGATCLWRTPSYTIQDIARRGLPFLQEKAAKFGLQ